MHAKILGGVLLMTGLFSVGCGGPEMQTEEQSTLETRKDELPACGGQEYERSFYSEPEHINLVGTWMCTCGSSSAYIYGRTTAYSVYEYINYCPGW